MKQKYNELKRWFNSYVNKFNLSDPVEQENIELKIRHSYRVCKTMNRLLESFNLTQNKKYTARIIALFHDIGRFKQYYKYKTFSDYQSEDHGQLGVGVIRENNLLENIKPEFKNIINKAIYYHNKPSLPENKDDNFFYARLIRDADKLDIWHIFVDKYKNENTKNYTINLSYKDDITEEIYKKILNKKLIKYSSLKTVNDLKLMQMSWIYDINFKKSFEIIKEKNYIDIIYKSMVKKQKSKIIYENIKEYIAEQLNFEGKIS